MAPNQGLIDLRHIRPQPPSHYPPCPGSPSSPLTHRERITHTVTHTHRITHTQNHTHTISHTESHTEREGEAKACIRTLGPEVSHVTSPLQLVKLYGDPRFPCKLHRALHKLPQFVFEVTLYPVAAWRAGIEYGCHLFSYFFFFLFGLGGRG